MSLRRRGQHYFLDLRVVGKRYRRALHTSLKSEAQEKYDEERAKILAMHGQGQPRFEHVIEAYLDWAKSSHPASAGREEQRLGKIKAWLVSKDIVHLSEFTSLQAEQLRSHLRDQGLSRATINRYAQILRGLFYRAKDWGFFRGDNPLRKIRFYREDRALRPLTDKEVKKILAAARDLGRKARSPAQRLFFDLARLALNTGMRKSEILNLRWADIQEGRAIVRGKGDKLRSVPLNSTARGIIQGQPRKTEYIFDIPNRHQHDLLRRTVDGIEKMTGIPFHFHLLRHRFASQLVARGVDLVTVARILGHSKLTTTLIYSHSSDEQAKRAVELLA